LVINKIRIDTQDLNTGFYDVLMAKRVEGENNKFKKWSEARKGKEIRTSRSI